MWRNNRLVKSDLEKTSEEFLARWTLRSAPSYCAWSASRELGTTLCPCSDCYAVDLEHHLNRCPSRQHLKKLEAKPFTRSNVNAGCSHSAAPQFQHLQEEQPLDGTKARVAASFELGVGGMQTLIGKVKKIAAQV